MSSAGSWGDKWVSEQGSRPEDDPQKWSNRAPHYGAKTTKNDYSLRFIDRLALEPGDSVMDMGCGNGLIALPLAAAGHPVLACDFSQGMLDSLREGIGATGVTGVETKLMSWEDDWEAFGVLPNSVDVAFASRSLITKDMRTSLLKLTTVARKRCCATLGTGYAPKVSAGIMAELGAETAPVRDYQYAFNILIEEGFFPRVSYICNDRRMSFDSAQEACDAIEAMVLKSGPRGEGEVRRMLANVPGWVDEHLLANEDAGKKNTHGRTEGALKIVVPDDIIWAFISWIK